MPTYEVTSPDGRKFDITAPEGATQDQVLTYAKTQFASMPKKTATPVAPIPPETTAAEAALIGAGRGLTQLGRGVQQAFYGLTGDEQAQAALKAKSDEETRLYKPLEDAHPIATAIGEGAPVALGGPLTMAAAGALEYGTPQEKAIRAAGGLVGGKVGQLAGKGIGLALQPVRSAVGDTASALFEKYGMKTLPSQITDSAPVKWLESTLASLPGGGAIRAAVADQQRGLDQAAVNAMGGSGSMVTPEAVQAARSAVGQGMGKTTSPVTVVTDNELLNRLGDIETRYGNKLDSLQKPIVQKLIDEISAMPSMPGEFYQMTRSDISKMAASASGTFKDALAGIYKALDGAFDRSAGPDAAEAMKVARGQYRAAKKLEPIANESGHVSAARVANNMKGLPDDLGELAQVAEKMRPLPNSGTAQRLAYQGLLSGGVGAGADMISGDHADAAKWGAGAFLAPAVLSRLLTSDVGRAYLSRGLLALPPAVEAALERAGGAGGGLLGLSVGR